MTVTEDQIKEHLQKVLATVSEVEIPTALATLSAAIVVILLGGVKEKDQAIKVLDDILSRGKIDLETNWDRRWLLKPPGAPQ